MIEQVLKKPLNLLSRKHSLRDLKLQQILSEINIVLDNLNFSVEGSFHYEEVKKLNELTGHFARYGYSPGKGAVAIIGLPNPDFSWNCFKDVCAYGEIPPSENLIFFDFNEEDATHISNYSIYGHHGIHEISKYVKFKKVSSAYDSRYISTLSHDYRVIDMKCKLAGTYTFDDAEFLNRHQDCWSINRHISYAVLETGHFIAILGFSNRYKDEIYGFRDVWELNKPKPDIQSIAFLSDEDALRIKEFSVYLYDYNFIYNPNKEPKIAKLDRTFSKNFDFYDTPTGKDLRLIES